MLYALLTTLFGAVGLWVARLISHEESRTWGWPTVPGRILERGVGPPRGARNYTVRVRYAYAVAGREYESGRVHMVGEVGYLFDHARRVVDGLPDPVPVHYNPDDPSEAYLLRPPRITWWIAFVVGAVVFTVGLLLLLVEAVALL